MKHSLLSLLVLVAGQISFAQVTSPGVVPGGTVSARDGFTKSGTSILLTRNGVSQKIDGLLLETPERPVPVPVAPRDGGVLTPGANSTAPSRR